MISYAQNFEDVVLDRVFHQVERGRYIDVGGYDPVIDSVTKHFYDKGWSGVNIEPVARFFVPRGYVCLLQDLRGRGNSDGKGQYFHVANINEGKDGHDSIEWTASQPWCNGRVGMLGSSHMGIVQNAAALERPPHLKALWVDVAPTMFIDGCAREGGAQALHMFGALFLHGFDAQEIRDNPAARKRLETAVETLRDQLYRIPFKPGHTPLSPNPNFEELLFQRLDGLRLQ